MSCNCNNMGSCEGGCGGAVMIATMQQGDTFPVYMSLKNDNAAAVLSKSQNLIIAFWDYKKQLICRGSTSDGSVIQGENGLYTYLVSHRDSVKMVGKVYIETTITDGGGVQVYHGDKVVSVVFEPRMNNEIV